MKAFAETDRLEVQDTIPQVDSYQAYSRQVWAPQDGTTTINLDIGGTSSNVAGYRCGGMCCFGDADDTARLSTFVNCYFSCDVLHFLRNPGII